MAHLPQRGVISIGADREYLAIVESALALGTDEKGKVNAHIIRRLPLRHKSRAFIGCFAIHVKSQIDYPRLTTWKEHPHLDADLTTQIVNDMMLFIQNRYDFITVPPMSAMRDLNNYGMDLVAQQLSNKIKIEYVPVFEQREFKRRHGVHANVEQDMPQLRHNIEKKVGGSTILLIDDFINSTMTARFCFQQLREIGCHVDGLVWVTE